MNSAQEPEDAIAEAVAAITHYVTEVTGQTPSREEIARALRRYFVLKEITDNIVMEWEGNT